MGNGVEGSRLEVRPVIFQLPSARTCAGATGQSKSDGAGDTEYYDFPRSLTERSWDTGPHSWSLSFARARTAQRLLKAARIKLTSNSRDGVTGDKGQLRGARTAIQDRHSCSRVREAHRPSRVNPTSSVANGSPSGTVFHPAGRFGSRRSRWNRPPTVPRPGSRGRRWEHWPGGSHCPRPTSCLRPC